MRAVSRKYSFWLSGFYDDFIGARTIPDDSNVIGATYLSSKSHHGNPINGLAPMNPRYNYAWVERGDAASSARFPNAVITAATSNGKQYLHNQGISEWLTYDQNRRGADKWEGRAQLEFPDSLTGANRQVYNAGANYDSGDAKEGYIWICNGYDTSGKYWIPTGDTDSTGGRGAREEFHETTGAIDVDSGAATSASASTHLDSFIQYAHLTSVYMGELTNQTTTNPDNPSSILTPITSPAKTPFMAIQVNRDMGTVSERPDKPVIIYDGALNSIGDKDVFSIRFCAQAFAKTGISDDWRGTIKVGFGANSIAIGTGAPNIGVPSYSGNPLISHAFDSTGTGFKNAFNPEDAFFDWIGSTAQTATTEDDWWQDFDFVMNYTANTYDVYHNGVKVNTSGAISFASTTGTAADMVGFQIDFGTTSTDDNWQGVFLLDRASMCFPLTDHVGLTETENNKMSVINMNWTKAVNSASGLNIQVADDENIISSAVKNIIQSSTFSYTSLLLFRDDVSRVLWRGIVSNVSQKQKVGTNVISISSADYSSLLDHEIPNWQIGQGGDADSTEAISFKRGETQTKLDMYYFGVQKLQVANKNLGFDYGADSALIPYVDSRMRRSSAHPIQMYNNEDTLGPNSAEDEWVSQGVVGAFLTAANKAVVYSPTGITATSSTTLTFEDSTLINGGGDYAVQSSDATYGNQGPIRVLTTDATASLEPANAVMCVKADPGDGSHVPHTNEAVRTNAYDTNQSLTIAANTSATPGEFLFWRDTVGYTGTSGPTYTLNGSGFIRITFTTTADASYKYGDIVILEDAIVSTTENYLAGLQVVGVDNNDNSLVSLGSTTATKYGVNDVATMVVARHDARNFTVRYYYDGNSSMGSIHTLGSIPIASTGSPLVMSDWFSYSKVKAVDVSGFATSGSVTYTGGSFNYTGIDTNYNFFTGVSSLSGTVTPGLLLTSGDTKTGIKVIGDQTGSLSVGDYFGLDGTATAGAEGIWKILAAPAYTAAAPPKPAFTTLTIDHTYAGGDDFTGGQLRWGTSYVRLGPDRYNPDYRSIHARWIRDIAASKWVKHMFGRIEKAHAGEAALTADFTNGTSTTLTLDSIWPYYELKGGGSFEIIGADGIMDAGIATSVSGAVSKLIFKIERDSNGDALFFIDGIAPNPMDGSGDNLKQGHQIVIIGSTYPEYEGIFTVESAVTLLGTRKKLILSDINGEIVKAIDTDSIFTGNGVAYILSTSGSSALTVTLEANHMLSRSHLTGATLRVRSFVNDYKHLWVLWADMRNTDGADADGGARKIDFGLLYPANQNYSLGLTWADQDVNAYAGRSSFTDLKIGEDVELWALDSTIEPISQAAWSALGSNSESNPAYHNWENKAGAFVIIDTSKFFNLNTESNGGATGQISGGTKELGDFLIETEGFPVIIDNYWAQAPATHKTADGEIIQYHVNQNNFISDPSLIRSDIITGDKWIQIGSTDEFPSAGMGQVVSQKSEMTWFYQWSAKGSDTAKKVALTDVSAATTEPYITTLTIGAGMAADLRAYDGVGEVPGMQIEISGYSALNGTYRVEGVVDATHIKIRVPAAIGSPVSGLSGTVEVVDSLYIGDNTLLFEGRTKVSGGGWNGLGYTNADVPNSSVSASAEQILTDAGDQSGSTTTIRITGDDKREDLTAYNSLSNVFPMRLLMQIEGFVKNKNVGTFYEHDKVRTVWADSLLKTWLSQSTLSAPHSLSGVPISNNMTTTQKGIDTTGVGGFSSGIVESATGVYTVTTTANHGVSVGDIITLSSTTALDGTYTVTIVPLATTFSFATTAGLSVSSAAPFWWKTGGLDDFGSINDSRSDTILSCISSARDGSGQGETNGENITYSWLIGRDGQMSYRPTYGSGFSFVGNDGTPANNNLIVSDMNAQSMNQITNVRVVYSGGSAFVDYPAPALGTRARWNILDMPNIGNQSEATAVAKQEFNKGKESPLSISAQVQRLSTTNIFSSFDDTTNDVLLDDARYGYISDPTRRSVGYNGTYWTAQLGGCLFPGMVNALNGPEGAAAEPTTTASRAWDKWYYWYGANSVTNAVQVVQIPRGMPKTSEATPSTNQIVDTLRIAILPDENCLRTLGPDDNPRFKIWLLDYQYTNSASGSMSPTRAATNLTNGKTSVSVQGNGFYEVSIPTSYWPAAGTNKIIISVNYDYLIALLRYRCGLLTESNFFSPAAAPGFVSFSHLNANSIFPLGLREYSEMSHGYGTTRAEWYAPRLLITDDVNFMPATTVDYTDSFLGLANEALAITKLNYTLKAGSSEKLSFVMERDVSRYAKGFNSMFMPSTMKTQITGGVNKSTGGPGTAPPNGPWNPNWGGAAVFNSGGVGSSNPSLGGAFTGSGGWGGDVSPNTNLSGQFNPLQNPSPSGSDNPGAGAASSAGIGSGQFSSATNRRMKGAMDLMRDLQVGGNFSILGQKKPGGAPSTSSGVTPEVSFSPTAGSAASAENGLVFPGTVGEAGANYPLHECSATIKVPNSVKDSFVNITGKISFSDSSPAQIKTEVFCNEVGLESDNTLTLGATSGTKTLFSGYVKGAETGGNTITVKISRTPDDGTDTAKYSSVIISNIQVGINRNTTEGTTLSNQMTYSNG